MSVTVYVSIGNSDDKLSQRSWSDFIDHVRTILKSRAVETYGEWHSLPDSVYQNMCICVTVHPAMLEGIRSALGLAATVYKQDSIAMAVVGRTELIGQLRAGDEVV